MSGIPQTRWGILDKETSQKRICGQEVEHRSRVSVVELKADSAWAALERALPASPDR